MLFTFAFLTTLSLVSAEILGFTNNKHYKPHCCGCETSHDASRIRILTQNFFEAIGEDQFENAYVQTLPCAPVFAQANFCNNGAGCCYTETNFELLGFVKNNTSLTYWVVGVEKQRDGDFYTWTDTIFAQYSLPCKTDLNAQTLEPAKSNLYQFFLRWTPTEGCNYKIAEIGILSADCQLEVELDCDVCIEN